MTQPSTARLITEAKLNSLSGAPSGLAKLDAAGDVINSAGQKVTGTGSGTATNGSIVEASLSTAFLRTIAADLRWNGTGTQPLRSTVTSDVLRPVNWYQPTQPPTTAGYAISGLDRWYRTT